MGCIALVRCVLVLRCGLAGLVWYPYAGCSTSDLFVELFHWLYCSGSMCVGVTLLFGCGGVVSLCSVSACIRIPHYHISNQSNTTHEITQRDC